MKIQKGAKLSYINEPGTVTLVAVLDGNQLLVEDEHGFEIQVEASQLMTTTGKLLGTLLAGEPEESQPKKKATPQKWPRGVVQCTSQEVVVDLHLEELCDAGEERFIAHPLELQLKTLRKTLSCAREYRVKNVVVIHGKGKGVLRQEVLHLLRGEQHLEFWDESFEKYGGGAIRVTLFGITK